jgi:hypothetical protein
MSAAAHVTTCTVKPLHWFADFDDQCPLLRASLGSNLKR